MKFNEMTYAHVYRIWIAVGVGLAVVMPLIYFTTPRKADTPFVVIEMPEQQTASVAAAPEFVLPPETPEQVQYIEVLNGCASGFEGACVNVRSGPGTEYPVVATLRTGIVLRVEKTIQDTERNWYKIMFDEWVRYPDRVAKNWYIAADVVQTFRHAPPAVLSAGEEVVTSKRIIVDRSKQMLYAYDGETLFMEQSISSGNDDTPTPRGSFKIFSKTPSRYMQGPVPGITTEDDVYDLPGVPWTMYFTKQGGAIHGAYWHDEFGNQHSHGCVNLPPQRAKELYEWAPLGTPVTVRD